MSSAEVAGVLTAYLGTNPCPASEIPQVAAHIRIALKGETAPEPGPEKPTPEEIQASITDEYLVSFEDGKRYKVLTRHLGHRGLNADEYRQKYGLPAGYPMVAAAFSRRRSDLAKEHGFGQTGRGGKS